MIWLTWRQSRVQVAVVSGGVAALLVLLAIASAQLPAFDTDYLRALEINGLGSAMYVIASVVILCVPAIVGVFWGAPLVARELEAGTHRLAWTQSVTRTRWLATKLGVTGLAAMAITGLASLLMLRWSGSLDTAINTGQTSNGPLGVARIAPPFFGARGIAPIGYAAFALALGVSAGIVARRVVPAMAITLALFVAVQIAMPAFLREHIGPTTVTTAITGANVRGLMVAAMGPDGVPQGPVRELTVQFDRPGAWITANRTIDRNGRVMTELPSWFARCVPAKELGPARGPAATETSDACFARAAREGYQQRVTFQPASRYWTLQAIETAIFLALAALLTAGSFWWLRQRVT
jgi:ABC-type transport system involved in multi-copper enzyme maturation permease subunit